MFTWCVTVLVMSVLHREVRGSSFPQLHVERQMSEVRRKAGAGHAPAPGSSSGHIKNMMEELRNWSQSYEGSQPWSLRSLPGAPFRGSRPTPVPLSGDATQGPSFTNARKFWNDFMFRRRSDFQSIVALRNREVQQKTCHTIPFQQKVDREGCETVAVKNNLCFGQCGPGHAPCSRCAPVKVARRTVQLKCAGDTRASKVVTMVEECQCELRRGRHCVHHRGPVLIDPSLPEKHS